MTFPLVVLVESYSQERMAKFLVDRALKLTHLKVDYVIHTATDVVGAAKPKAKDVHAGVASTWDRLERQPRDVRVLAMGGSATTHMARSRTLSKITELRGAMYKDDETGILYVPTVSPGQVYVDPDMFTDLLADLVKLLTQDEPIPLLLPGDIDWAVETVPALAWDALNGTFDGASAISLDVETYGFDANLDRLMSVGLGARYGPGESVVRIFRGEALEDPQITDRLWELTFSRTHTTVYHNAKFDLQFMMRYFGISRVEAEARIGDTMLLHHLLDERPLGKMHGSVHSLKTLARVYYDQPDYHWDFPAWFKKLADGKDTPEDWDAFDWYHARDCHFTIQLWFDLREEAAREGRLLEVHDGLLGRASAVVAEMELRGAPISITATQSLDRDVNARIDSKRANLVGSRVIREWPDMNIEAPQQIVALLKAWGCPPAGAKQSMGDKAGIDRAIEHLTRAGEEDRAQWLRDLLSLRKDLKTGGTYTSSMLEKALEHEDGYRIHGSFWLAGSVTGRLSSSQPNLQNVPARTGENVRALYAARPGFVWLDCDYSQLELRVVASFSGDPEMRRVFDEGLDIHRVVASRVFDKPMDQITDAERFIAKSVDFGLIYGQTAWALAADEKIAEILAAEGKRPLTQDTAEQIMDAFLEQFPRLSRWLSEQEKTAQAQGFVDYRRRRRFLLQSRDKSDQWARKRMGAVDRQAKNSPIQGTASDINLDALCRVAEYSAMYKQGTVEVLFPVHDSICLHVREDLVDEVAKRVKEIMSTLPSWFDHRDVRYVADAKAGRSWGELTKFDNGYLHARDNH